MCIQDKNKKDCKIILVNIGNTSYHYCGQNTGKITQINNKSTAQFALELNLILIKHQFVVHLTIEISN